MKILISFLLFSFFISQVNGQEVVQPKLSFGAEIGLPSQQGNAAFREIMQGLLTVSPNLQYTLDNGIAFGGGLRYSFFTINEFKVPNKLAGGMHMAGAFAKVGHEKFYSSFGTDFGIRFGYNKIYSINEECTEVHGKAHSFDAGFIEPHVGLALMADEKSSYRLAISYVFQGFAFDAQDLCLDELSAYTDNQLSKGTHYFTIGFGYSYYFGRK